MGRISHVQSCLELANVMKFVFLSFFSSSKVTFFLLSERVQQEQRKINNLMTPAQKGRESDVCRHRRQAH